MSIEDSKITIIKKALLAIFGVLAVVSFLKGIQNGLTNPVDFLWSDFRDAIYQKQYYGPQFPFTFWMMFPFGLLPEMYARVVWIICNLVFTVIIAWTLKKTFLKELPDIDYTILILIMISGGGMEDKSKQRAI